MQHPVEYGGSIGIIEVRCDDTAYIDDVGAPLHITEEVTDKGR